MTAFCDPYRTDDLFLTIFFSSKVSRGTTKFCAAHGGGQRCRLHECGRAVISGHDVCRNHLEFATVTSTKSSSPSFNQNNKVRKNLDMRKIEYYNPLKQKEVKQCIKIKDKHLLNTKYFFRFLIIIYLLLFLMVFLPCRSLLPTHLRLLLLMMILLVSVVKCRIVVLPSFRDMIYVSITWNLPP